VGGAVITPGMHWPVIIRPIFMSRVVRKVRGRKRYTESLLLLPEDKDKRSWFSEGEMSAAAFWSRVCPPEVGCL